jgi:hypothetical protein
VLLLPTTLFWKLKYREGFKVLLWLLNTMCQQRLCFRFVFYILIPSAVYLQLIVIWCLTRERIWMIRYLADVGQLLVWISFLSLWKHDLCILPSPLSFSFSSWVGRGEYRPITFTRNETCLLQILKYQYWNTLKIDLPLEIIIYGWWPVISSQLVYWAYTTLEGYLFCALALYYSLSFTC